MKKTVTITIISGVITFISTYSIPLAAQLNISVLTAFAGLAGTLSVLLITGVSNNQHVSNATLGSSDLTALHRPF